MQNSIVYNQTEMYDVFSERLEKFNLFIDYVWNSYAFPFALLKGSVANYTLTI